MQKGIRLRERNAVPILPASPRLLHQFQQPQPLIAPTRPAQSMEVQAFQTR